MRESASDPPYIILFDMICFVFITHIAKNIFGFLFNGEFNFFPPFYVERKPVQLRADSDKSEIIFKF